MQHLGKILPVDGYEVKLETSLPVDYIQSLTHLYQPLLGMEAVSLYQLLLQEIEIQSVHLQTHHTLMNYLNLPLDKIYEARLKLEGIGLLKTFKKETEDRVFYTYMLLAPFSPDAFFRDMMLSELLYRHIGSSKFHSLKDHYATTKEVNGENITAVFSEVFQTFEPQQENISSPVQKQESSGVPIERLDFSFLKQALKRKMISPKQVLTETNQKVISQLVQLYDLETYEVEKAVEWALTEENRLDIEQLRAICHEIFQSKHNVNNLELSVKQSSKDQRSEKPLTKMEKLIQKFETISPKELLEDLSSGNNASDQDMKLINEVMISQGLPVPVMNVLIHYVMLRSDMRLPEKYMKTIASNWSRMKFKSAKEAIDFVRKQAEPKKKQQRYKNYQSKNMSNEIIPDWFKERKKQREESKETVLTKEQMKEQEEMVALLQKYASENN